MYLNVLTLLHTLISLIGIASGFVVLYNFVSSRTNGSTLTTVFLWTTLLTSVTGFMFPFRVLLPSHVVGVLSFIALAVAFATRSRGGRAYTIGAIASLYLNVFVLIAQIYDKVPPLRALAPTKTEPPFQITQLVTLAVFAWLTVRAARKTPSRSAVPAAS